MPYCPKCGVEVGEAHFYCGQCGAPLVEDDEEPPMHATHHGFLTGRSRQYLNGLVEDNEVDRDSPGHRQVTQDLRDALSDLGVAAVNGEINILDLVFTLKFPSGYPDVDPDEMTREERESVAAFVGLSQTLELYDRALETDWSDEFYDRLLDRIREVVEESDVDMSNSLEG